MSNNQFSIFQQKAEAAAPSTSPSSQADKARLEAQVCSLLCALNVQRFLLPSCLAELDQGGIQSSALALSHLFLILLFAS